MLTGVNDSTKETKFVSEAYKLVEGKHLENEDKNKILMHKDLALIMILLKLKRLLRINHLKEQRILKEQLC
ncbi:hypothetical protein EfmAA96_32200 (plasmid) [Enterococcus faecium]|nr:hypothetical protein EfmAA96_32200 [Enterococcus faecium]